MGYYDEIAQGYNELHLEEQLSKLSIIKNNPDEVLWFHVNHLLLLKNGYSLNNLRKSVL